MFNSKSETFIFANCFLCKKRKVVGLALLLAWRQYVNNGMEPLIMLGVLQVMGCSFA